MSTVDVVSTTVDTVPEQHDVEEHHVAQAVPVMYQTYAAAAPPMAYASTNYATSSMVQYGSAPMMSYGAAPVAYSDASHYAAPVTYAAAPQYSAAPVTYVSAPQYTAAPVTYAAAPHYTAAAAPLYSSAPVTYAAPVTYVAAPEIVVEHVAPVEAEVSVEPEVSALLVGHEEVEQREVEQVVATETVDVAPDAVYVVAPAVEYYVAPPVFSTSSNYIDPSGSLIEFASPPAELPHLLGGEIDTKVAHKDVVMTEEEAVPKMMKVSKKKMGCC